VDAVGARTAKFGRHWKLLALLPIASAVVTAALRRVR
jgi:hypothetical protein